MINKYVKNLDRIEFLVTLACTGRCKHCSEGDHANKGEFIDGDIAADVVFKVCGEFSIKSLMTFGGEALLFPDAVSKIHSAAKQMNIPKRQLITNGYFSNNESKIKSVAEKLASCGVNDILLSVDALHQETIPLMPVKVFARAIQSEGVRIRSHPAWLVSANDENPYNMKTREILKEFEAIGIFYSDGNTVFPNGNAKEYLDEYFDPDKEYINPYDESPFDIYSLSVSPDGSVLDGNIYKSDIHDILSNYNPKKD